MTKSSFHGATLPPKSRFIEALALLLILSLAAYLRLANHTVNPGWYTDEGTHLDIARRLRQGQVQYLAIHQSFLLFGRLPLFDLLLAGASGLHGEGMDTLRTLTGGLGVVSVGMIYGVVHVAQKETGQVDTLALLAAFMLAIYPQAIIYSRFGFSYNLLSPLVLLTCLGLLKYLDTMRRRWLAVAALAVGVGIVSDLWMMALAPALMLVVAMRRWYDGLWSLPLAALPFSLYVSVMLISAPQAFAFDWRYTLSRLGAIPLPQQFATLADNYATLVTQDGWIAAASVGLFLLRPVLLQRLGLLLFGLPILILGRTVALYSLSFYYMIPLIPFVALGAASLVRYGAAEVTRIILNRSRKRSDDFSRQPPKATEVATTGQFRGRLILRLRSGRSGLDLHRALSLVILTLFATSLPRTLYQIQNGFDTSIDIFLINPADARAAAAFVNEQIGAEDVIIASPAVAWLLQANTADFQMAVAATGRATVHLPADIPAARFVFDPRLTQARFVVIDSLWRNWGAVNMPEVDALMRQVENWPTAFEAGEITVYRNPTR